MIIWRYVSRITNVDIRVGQVRITLGSLTAIDRQLDETRVFSGGHRQIT